jgi:hypothetical protein
METSSLHDPTLGAAYSLMDDDTPIVIQDSNGNKIYIDKVTIVVNSERPILLLIVAPF